LRKWKSNSAELMEIIGEEDIGQECKVLGISWNKANDEFVFELAKFASGFIKMAVTKRKVVSVVAQLFDLLELLSPIFVIANILLQKIHTSNADWDIVVDSIPFKTMAGLD